jgi:hypothetical protein
LDGEDHLLPKSSPFVHSEHPITEDDTSFVKRIKNLRQRLKGWRFGVLLASVMASCVLLMNCIAAVVINSTYFTREGVSTAYEGDCDVANRWSFGLHIAINILSSLLLSASNYTMQVLNAPTRSECDKAHARGDWVDIGVTSLRNIARITWPRRVLWLLLGLSSVPIHLFYNSAAFKTISTNNYNVTVATPLYLEIDVLPPLKWQNSTRELFTIRMPDRDTKTMENFRQSYQSRKQDFVNLTASECINTYGVDYVTGHSDVIAVTSEPHPANATVAVWTESRPSYNDHSFSYNW